LETGMTEKAPIKYLGVSTGRNLFRRQYGDTRRLGLSRQQNDARSTGRRLSGLTLAVKHGERGKDASK
jgi:hypothetical protein